MNALEILVQNEVIYEPKENVNFNLIISRDAHVGIVKRINKSMKQYLSNSLEELYKECEHGDDEHRKWLKDKFDDFLKRQMNE